MVRPGAVQMNIYPRLYVLRTKQRNKGLYVLRPHRFHGHFVTVRTFKNVRQGLRWADRNAFFGVCDLGRA